MTNNKYKSFKDWMLDQYSHNELADIANHGCMSGFSGLIYYSETTTLYNEYKDDIWEMVAQDVEDFGYKSDIGFIDSFTGAQNVTGADQFENLLVWYAAEKIAWQQTDGEYKDED